MSSGAQLIKTYRERLRWSQSQLARTCQFDHSYLSKIEAGSKSPTHGSLIMICDSLRLTMAQKAELLHAYGYRLTLEESPAYQGEEDLLFLQQCLLSSDDRLREAAVDIVSATCRILHVLKMQLYSLPAQTEVKTTSIPAVWDRRDRNTFRPEDY